MSLSFTSKNVVTCASHVHSVDVRFFVVKTCAETSNVGVLYFSVKYVSCSYFIRGTNVRSNLAAQSEQRGGLFGLFVQRQVGFDRQHRPVIYSCFAQAACVDTTIDDTIIHMTHLFENAKKTMTGDVSSWVLVVDCTGQWFNACRRGGEVGRGNDEVCQLPEVA